ncbi:aminoglycoside phosphotransferase family protein [Actinomadura verrucosospora]|uniref:aminoglycoside phosphotransferase family protein n=1 Tax=Actinomadura verrucosospora TaxID=46165 RepID=UPI0015636834|nr:phosphotransferase [Actinomadura verrucosospora]
MASKVRRERGRVPFSHQFAIMQALARTEAGAAVRPPLRPGRRNGRSWVDGPVNRWFVRSYTEHDRAPDWSSSALVADAAEKLSLIHSNASIIDAKVLKIPARRLGPYEWGLADTLDRVDVLVRDMEARRRTPQHIALFRREMDRLRGQRRGLDLGREGLTHHDLRPENLLVRDGRVAEIVDWDRAHWDVQWYDVTLAALHLAYLQPVEPRWDLAESFMDAYRDASGTRLSTEATDWLLRYTAVRNLAVSRSPDKWDRLVKGIAQWRGAAPSLLVDDLVAGDQVAAHVDVAVEDGGAVEAAGVG